MTKEEIIAGINRLPVDERLEIVETVTRDLRKSMKPTVRKGSPVERVSGLLKTEGPAPTDEEIKRDYIDYLDTKYS
jgi:hypothetical protein